MAQPLNVLTPPPSATSFISSTPTASLRSSATARRLSVVSLDPDLDLSKEGDHPERSRDSRIEKWLQQQCGGFLAWEHKRTELNSHEMGIPLRRVQSSGTLLTTNNTATTPVTNASFSWESDMLLSTSPTTPSSSPAVPSAPVPNFSSSTHLPSKPQFQPAHPETEAARADSPLLGFPALAVAELTAPSTLGKPLDGAKPADVDKPLPLPPTTLDTNVLTSANAASTVLCLNEVPPVPGTTPVSVRRGSSQIHPKLTPNHSPTPSYSSSDSSRQCHSRSHSNGHAQLPIGVANPQEFVHSRTPSGSSTNGHGGHVSRTSSFASSVQAAISLSLATLAPTRREMLPELRQGSGTRSFLPLSPSTRKRSHSNAIPSAMKQFHLPTGMVHRSQSHAQLRNGPVPLSTFSSHDLQASKGVSHPHLASSLLSVSGGTGVALRLAKKLSKSVISPSISRTHSSTPSYASVSVVSRDDAVDPLRSRPSQFSPTHTRQTSEILERLESRVPSLSSSFSRNAVYIDSEDISARLDELLLLAKEEVENRVEEEDEDTVEAGEGGITGGDQWVDMVKGHSCGEGSINQPIASPPNTPATGSAVSVTGFQTAGAGNGFYGSPEAGSSQVYLGSNPISQNHSIEQLSGKHLCIGQNLEVLRPSPAPPSEPIDPDTTIKEVLPIVDFVPQEEIVEAFLAADMDVTFFPKSVSTPEPIEDEETMEDALALARELAVEDRMVWGVRTSLEIFDDCWSEFEDEEMGVGVCTMSGVPRMSVGPGPYAAYCSAGKGSPGDGEGHVRFRLGDGHSHDIRNGGLAPPSVSKWSLTSSIDEEKRASLDDRPKKDKKRRSFVPFIVSGDKDKEHKDDVHKEHGTIGKKRNRLASFISRLSGVGLGGLGGSGSNSPSLQTPPFPMLSPSSSSNALSGLFSAAIPSMDSPLLPTLTPNFSATPSRSSSPKALDPQIQRQPQVTIIADDDCSISSPSSSRLILTSPPTSRPLTPPPQIIPPMTSRRPLPPGIVIPPLPSRPPPELPTVAPPLGKAASESLINAKSPPPLVSRPRSNSTADSFGRHVTFTNSLHAPSSSSPRMEQASMTLPSTLRRSVLAKSASASVLGLHQQLKPLAPTVPADAAAEAGYDDDDGLIPPTPTSIISTEEYGEARRREDFYDDGHGLQSKRLRLRAMSSLGSLPLNGIVNPGPPRTKGGIKGFVGRLTGRGKNPAKVNQVHLSPSFFGTDNSNHRTVDDSELSTPVTMYSPKMSSPKHSPSPSFSNGGNAPAASGVGVLSGFKLYLERTPFRQS